MPLYAVTDTENSSVRLVEAHSRAAAYKHVSEDRFVVSIPDALEAARMAAEGVSIEKAVPRAKRGSSKPQEPEGFDPGE